MWIIGLCIVAVLVVYLTYWLNKWSNPKCNGVFPPGSMGLPLIGETLQMTVPSDSLDLHAFIKKRAQRLHANNCVCLYCFYLFIDNYKCVCFYSIYYYLQVYIYVFNYMYASRINLMQA